MVPSLRGLKYRDFIDACGDIPNEAYGDMRSGFEKLAKESNLKYLLARAGCFVVGSFNADDCVGKMQPANLSAFYHMQGRNLVQKMVRLMSMVGERFVTKESLYFRNPSFKNHHGPGCAFLNDALEQGLSAFNLTMF